MPRDVHSCTHWLRSRNPLLPRIWTPYTRALLVSQDRRHLLVTPWVNWTFVKTLLGTGGRAQVDRLKEHRSQTQRMRFKGTGRRKIISSIKKVIRKIKIKWEENRIIKINPEVNWRNMIFVSDKFSAKKCNKNFSEEWVRKFSYKNLFSV